MRAQSAVCRMRVGLPAECKGVCAVCVCAQEYRLPVCVVSNACKRKWPGGKKVAEVRKAAVQ